MFDTIVARSNEIADDLIAVRRDLHQHPELGWEEFRTTSIVVQRLRELGYIVRVGKEVCEESARMGVPPAEELESAYQRALQEGAPEELLEAMKGGFTGAVGILENGDGPVVGMRFDIDALPLAETTDPEHFPNREGFQSVHANTMHACGHDCHTSIGLGVAQLMMEMRDQWSGTLKLVFQPAEEGVRGAKSIVAHGHLDDVTVMLGSHVTASNQCNEFDIYAGAGGSLATTKLDVTYTGLASHAAGAPEKGRNVMPAVATAILNLYALPRNSQGETRVNVGVVHAGSGRNIIANNATMLVEIRGANTQINAYMEEYARRILEDAGHMHGVECEITKTGEAISLESSPELMERIDRVAEQVEVRPASPNRLISPGSEDYSFMMDRVQSNGGQASFIRILVDSPVAGHTVTFSPNEDAMVRGVRMFVGTALDVMALR